MMSSYKLLIIYMRKVSVLCSAYNLNLGNDALVSLYGDFCAFSHPFLCKCSMSYELGMKELTCFGKD